MNHATNFCNFIKSTHIPNSDYIVSASKEFTPLVRNHIFIPEEKYTCTVFNDDSVLTIIDGTIHITSGLNELHLLIKELCELHPNLEHEFVSRLPDE